MSNELAGRLQCVARGWAPTQHLHVGNVAWASTRADGSTEPARSLSWGTPVAGFADLWNGAESSTALLHLGQSMATGHRIAAIEELIAYAQGRVSLMASRQDRQTTTALHRTEFDLELDEPWFVQLWRSLDDLSDIHGLTTRADYEIRPVKADEIAARVQLHRKAWAPSRIKKLLGLTIAENEPGSSYTDSKHDRVIRTPIYRSDLDVVAVAADGTLAAYGLGWLGSINKSVLIEPVGTDPAHSGIGLAKAVCSQILQTAKRLGASQAIVGPRGDSGYPLPSHIYRGLGMIEVAQFVSYARGWVVRRS